MEWCIEERKEIERMIICQLVKRNSKEKLIDLPKNNLGKYMSLSPYQAHNNTTMYIDRFLRYKYSGLSKKIHNLDDERYNIEKEIMEIIYLDYSRPIHLIFQEWEEKGLICYCNRNKCKLPKKDKINRLWKLIREWREESQKIHYQITKQEKRKLKKKLVTNSEEIAEIYEDKFY